MLYTAFISFLTVMQGVFASTWFETLWRFIPFAIFLELPLFLTVMFGIVRYAIVQNAAPAHVPRRFPKVSCVITCYSEGLDVQRTIASLVTQNYPGDIEIIPVIDGSRQNLDTWSAARECQEMADRTPQRRLIVLPKWQRGGRVSSLNSGAMIATGEIIMALDGDTSFDNDMVYRAAAHFLDPGVIAVSGDLRVRNAAASLITRLQAVEYLVSISGGKTGLAEFGIINNISGAFGIFRAGILRHVLGWDAGTAEDLDMTQRLKQLCSQHRGLRIVFDPRVIGHTDAPPTFAEFFWQRVRWDGDLFYIYFRKYGKNLRPALLGWPNFFSHLVGGVLFQLVMPFMIIIYMGVLLWRYDTGIILGILAFVYLVYFLFLTILFTAFWLLVSERPKSDALYFLFLPIYPLYGLVSRFVAAIGILNEIVNRGHLDSAMAPWWVLRKTKF
ncbi:glycosyltransferase [Massilia sp. BSC265]|uniref:glycosyltransferase family 2 protein n=1 Tax=Massilia sp. BSC265 TaxID=1549812 RepID=UPI0004E92A56|nr:glycosyltransferase [Massilia sp. BSC265]KFI08748.1 N-acetylglucosaminyltransferase [Massilia sp. BSC265]